MRDFETAARSETGRGMIGEFAYFLKNSKKWWLLPMVIILLAFGILVFLSGTAAAPFNTGSQAGIPFLDIGNKYVAPVISPNGPMTDLDGNVISDGNGHTGFPGFNGMEAAVTLSYVASLQEHGVPVTYAYISDAHDNEPKGPAYGPGQAGYVAALAAYNEAFTQFFAPGMRVTAAG